MSPDTKHLMGIFAFAIAMLAVIGLGLENLDRNPGLISASLLFISSGQMVVLGLFLEDWSSRRTRETIEALYYQYSREMESKEGNAQFAAWEAHWFEEVRINHYAL
ncbi:MAG: hypothetical protein K9L32_04855 [Chromatiaceae bacterium]|nr:hypothetical protein [Chromatiaceae bacterium]